MTTVELDELPANLRAVAVAAIDVGWSAWATRAEAIVDDAPMTTLAVRFFHGPYRCYGVWRIDNGVRWKGGAARHVPPGPLRTVAALKTYLGIPATVPMKGP